MSVSIFYFAYVLKSSAANINADVAKRMVQCQQCHVCTQSPEHVFLQHDLITVWPNFAIIDYKLLAKIA